MVRASLKVAGFLALTLSAGSAAAYSTGNELHPVLNDSERSFRGTTYVTGVVDGLIFGYIAAKAESGIRTDASKLVGCMPEAVTNGQVRDVVQKYLNDNPAERHKRSTELVSTALQRAFPCKP